MNPQDLSEITKTLVTYPLAVAVVALAVSVVYLFKRLTALEKEFRDYIAVQGTEAKTLLDKAVRAIERLEALIDKLTGYELRKKD